MELLLNYENSKFLRIKRNDYFLFATTIYLI